MKSIILNMVPLLLPFSLMAKNPILVLDTLNNDNVPKHFRTTHDLSLYKIPSTISQDGLAPLNISGSAQYSLDQFLKIKTMLPNLAYIFDLRQEAHGFLDGNAISWYSPEDWMSLGDSDRQSQKKENILLKNLTVSKTVNIYTKDSVKKNHPTLWKSLTPKKVISENELITFSEVNYIRIYATDHVAPREDSVDNFLHVWETIPQGKRVHFHCAGGDGRTTTFMSMADMLENAKVVSFDDIIGRQAAIGPLDLRKMPSTTSPFYLGFFERLKFLKKFYEYAKSTSKPRPLWSVWKKTH